MVTHSILTDTHIFDRRGEKSTLAYVFQYPAELAKYCTFIFQKKTFVVGWSAVQRMSLHRKALEPKQTSV